MTRKVYRTAMGRMVDLGALQLKNENVRAVGNMPVNARGDMLDSANKPIDTRPQQVKRQYNRQSMPAQAPQKTNPVPPAPAVEIPPPPEDFEDDFVKPQEAVAPESTTGGLAAAIARARQIKQEPLKTSRQIAQEQAGVKKI